MGQFGQVLGIFFPIFCLGVEQKVETFGAGCTTTPAPNKLGQAGIIGPGLSVLRHVRVPTISPG